MGNFLYPETRRDDVVDVINGVTVLNPYRWLEKDSDEARLWKEEQNVFADQYLKDWPEREILRDVVRRTMLSGIIEDSDMNKTVGNIEEWGKVNPIIDAKPPFFSKKFIFHLGTLPKEEHLVLLVTDKSSWNQRVLVNPSNIGKGWALDWFFPSPDGSYVAFGISCNGDEQSILHVVDTITEKVLPDQIPFTSFASISWLSDSSGFYYSGGKDTDFENAEKWLFFHRLGDLTINEPELIRLNDPYVSPILSTDGKYLAVNYSWEKPCVAYFKNRFEDDLWRPFLRDIQGESLGQFFGDDFLALTTYKAPRGRIVSIPMETYDDENTWQEIVPESDAVLQSFVVVGQSILISELVQAYSRLRVFSLKTELHRVISFSSIGLIQQAGALESSPFAIDGQSVYFCYGTFTEPTRLYRYDFDTGILAPLGPEPKLDLSHLTVRQVNYSSKDKTVVPMFLIYRKDLDLTVPNNVILYGYGGWNMLPAPDYIASGRNFVLPFIESGGICAYPSLRGGCEFGQTWWMDGRRDKKQNTFNDFYAAAEFLIKKGLTTSNQLAISGASNGGLLTAVAITQRPDLFKVAISQVPLTDMIRALKDPYLSSYTVEYGDPNDSDMFPVLLSYSPVQNVKDGIVYPATFILCGNNDIRCQPWNGSKLAALLQHSTASDEPILLKIDSGGHGPGLSFKELVDRRVDMLGFIMQCLKMKVFETCNKANGGDKR